METKSRMQLEIERLVQEKGQLKKQWKIASEEQKRELTYCRRTSRANWPPWGKQSAKEQLRKEKNEQELVSLKTPSSSWNLSSPKKRQTLRTLKQDIEEHLERRHSDPKRHDPIVIPSDIPPIEQSEHQMYVSLSKCKEVENTVRWERASSAPGPNGVPYRVHRKCSWCSTLLVEINESGMGEANNNQSLAQSWYQLIPKEEESSNIIQFRPISLLNVKGKIFFSIISSEVDKLSGKEQAAVYIGPKSWNSRVLSILRWWSGTKSTQPRVTRVLYMSSSFNSLMHLGQYHIVSSGLLLTPSKYQSPSEILLGQFEDLHFCFHNTKILPLYGSISK